MKDHGNCCTVWYINDSAERYCDNCGKPFRVGERVRFSSTGLPSGSFFICANGVTCERHRVGPDGDAAQNEEE